MRSEQRMVRLEQVIRLRQPDLTVVMENIHDPHNVSAMLRSCDAAGVYEVQLVYTNEEYPGIGKKSSSSAKKWVERRNFPSVELCYARLRSEGYRIYATRLDERATPLYDLDLTQKVALVFGNEHRGVSDEGASLADGTVIIPMMGMIQSLNVSVACAVTLYEAVRQRLASGHYDSSKFPDEEIAALLKTWAMKE